MHPTIHRFTVGLPDHIATIGDPTFDPSDIFRDVPWGSPISFSEIIIGSGQEMAMTNARFSIITNKLLRIPNLVGIVVSVYDSSWIPGWEPQLVRDFPRVRLFAFRIVTSRFGLETVRTVQYNSVRREYLPSSTAFAQIPVNELTSETVEHVLSLENLEVMCLLAPSTHLQESASLYNLRYVERILYNASNLHGISMPFVMLKDSEIIFKALRRATSLKTINIAEPVTPVEFSLASDVNTLSAFTKGIESLTQLRKVSFPRIVIDFEPLRKVLERLSN